jgi:hypothetical protein
MAKVRFIRDTEESILGASPADGTIYVSTDTNNIYIGTADGFERLTKGYTLSKSGNSITLTDNEGNQTTVTDADTKYNNATGSAAGLMSASDKTKLDNLDSTISAAIGEEASARQKQDQLLEQAIEDKLGADDIVAGSNVQVSHDDESGHVTISATDTKYTAGIGLGLTSNSFSILNGGVGQNQLADDSVSESKLADGAVGTDKIANGAVTADKLAEGVIPEIPEVTLASLGITATAQELNYTDGVTSNIQTQLNGKAAASHTHDDRYYTEDEVDGLLAAKANTSHTHSAANITSGTLALDRIPTITDAKIQGMSASKLTGTIPQANLPSYVDDVLEFENQAAFPKTGESGKIYVAEDTNKTYRWGGASYVEISASLALGTTSSTAFRGDYGNTAYQHAQAKGSAFASGLYKITTNAQGHVTAATAVTKSDITALGIPGSDTNTNTTYTLSKSGSTITLEGSDGSSTSVTDANTTYTLSSFGVTATAAELNYTDGVTSNIQTQLNGKAASSHTHGTASTAAAGFLRQLNGSTSNFLRGDGTWATPPNTTYSAMKGATASDAGSTGLVPAPSAGAATRYLRSDGTWATPPDTNTTYSAMKGATSSAAGTAGLVPAPAAGAATRYLRSDGTWAVPPDTNTTYTLSSFGITATAAELNKLDGVTATATEINYLDGVTSAIQTQLNGKAASSHSHPASQVTGLTASRALISDADGHPAVSAVTSTELGYLDGVTSAIQTQLNGKASTSHTHSYLPLSGGTLTGTVTSRSLAAATDSTYDIGTSSVRYRNIYADNLYGTLQGSATSANKLTTACTISLTGDVTGSTSFNGSANVSISANLAANSVTANEIAADAVGSSELASNAVSLAKLASDVGTVAVQSSTPTDTNVKLWIQI